MRSKLRNAVLALTASWLCAAAAQAHLGFDLGVRVFVVVVEGLNPDEVGLLTPMLEELRSAGTWYEGAVSTGIAEMLPGHVTMLTGARPSRTGILADRFLSAEGELRLADSPGLLGADTLFTRLKRDCEKDDPTLTPWITTASVMPKPPLHRVFDAGGRQIRPDFHQQTTPVIPGPDFAPDALVMQDFLNWTLYWDPPMFGVATLADVAEAGRIDASGVTGTAALRAAALVHTDAQIRAFVDGLRSIDAWQSTILFVVSDHGTDWSLPSSFVDLTGALGDHGYGAGDFVVVAGGGAASIHVPEAESVGPIADVVRGLEGIGLVLAKESEPSLGDFGLDHERAGDIVVFTDTGYRFSDASPAANPWPGNNGNPPTRRTVLLVTGGHQAVAGTGSTVSGGEPAGVLSIAPTVAALFALEPPAGGYDGRILTEAFYPEIFQPGPDGLCSG